MLLRGARPFEVKLYLICLNNKCFDFQPIIYILILIVLNLDQVDLGHGLFRSEVPRTTYIKIFYIGKKSKHLLFKQIK